MQTEEETATAEEPILEDGSGREQVRKDIFCLPLRVPLFMRPVSIKVAHILHLQEPPCVFTARPQTTHHFYIMYTDSWSFIDETCICRCLREEVTFFSSVLHALCRSKDTKQDLGFNMNGDQAVV